MAKVRLDALPDRAGPLPVAFAGSGVGAGGRGPAARWEAARKPGQLVADDVKLEVVGAAAIRLARRYQARQRARRDRRRPRRPPRARRRRLDRRLHRLPAAARGRARRRLDVAYGELHWRLRNDPRVTVIERRNARDLRADELPYRPDLVVVDVSFISLAKVLPAVLAAAAPRYDCLALVKPQFEAGRDRVGSGGVVRDPDVRRRGAGGGGRNRERARRVRPGLRLLGPARPEGQPRDLRPPGRGRARRRRPTWRPRRAEGEP